MKCEMSSFGAPLLFIRGVHGLFSPEIEPGPPCTDFSVQWGADTSKMEARGAIRKRWPTDLKFVLEAAWWVPMSVMGGLACLKSVY